MNIAYFITPHGFGHASRAAAVMEAVSRCCPEIRFELFTTCPIQIFMDTIGDNFGYHSVQTDIGIVQLSPLEEDLTATCDQLDHLLPYDNKWIDQLAAQLNRLNCRMVICDIAPLGICVAQAAGLPSVLIENFTWDWIYESYSASWPRLKPHIAYLANLAQTVDHHIQTVPLCKPSNRAVRMGPISRIPRSGKAHVRKQLGVSQKANLVLVSMGGVPDRFDFLAKLPADFDWHLVIPGADAMPRPHKKVIALPKHSRFFHPDLMAAADVLIGKAGYSTVAEAYHTGIPFGYIRRPESPESSALEAFIKASMPAITIPTEFYNTGEWVGYLPDLLDLPRGPRKSDNGADEAARSILNLLQGGEGAISCVAKDSQ
jgi:hypothetical protein